MAIKDDLGQFGSWVGIKIENVNERYENNNNTECVGNDIPPNEIKVPFHITKLLI